MPDVPIACVLGCRSRQTGLPYLADPGYQTCTPCAERLFGVLREICGRYEVVMLPAAAVPGRTGEGRRAPGYASRSPAADHILCIRDPRSIAVHPGDPHSPLSILHEWAGQVRDERGAHAPDTPLTVEREAQTLRFNWDWVTRQEWVAEMARELREVRNQLATATGAPPPRPIGRCPNLLDDPDAEDPDEARYYCATTLYAPTDGTDTVACRGCGREWPRREWLRLGDLLTTNVVALGAAA